MTAMVELSSVTKVFGSGKRAAVTAVAGLDLEIAPETVTLVEGPNGSGKTTLLHLIGCLVRPTAGRIRVAGREVTRLPEDLLAEVRRRHFGFVFQSYHLVRGFSALANVMLPALPSAEIDGDLRRRARSLLSRFGLGDRAGERVELLSGGEQQRVAVARALINDPPVILADEPTAHLDGAMARSFLDLVRELRQDGKTLVVASHDPALCDADCFSARLGLSAGHLG